MRVPEYEDPIAVRWYTIPRPGRGVFDLTEYSSSHWDDDSSVSDPDLGEQASLSTIKEAWRDCTFYPFSLKLRVIGFHDMPEVPEGFTPGDWTHFNSTLLGWSTARSAGPTFTVTVPQLPDVPGGPNFMQVQLNGSTVTYRIGLDPDTIIASGVCPYRLADELFELTDYDPAWEPYIRPITCQCRAYPLIRYVAPDRWG